ncbi:hypothetical protein [Ensifer canadensis]
MTTDIGNATCVLKQDARTISSDAIQVSFEQAFRGRKAYRKRAMRFMLSALKRQAKYR